MPAEFETETWTELLTFGGVAGSRTAYRGVEQLLPGHWLRADTRGVKTGRWWRFSAKGPPADNADVGSLLDASSGAV